MYDIHVHTSRENYTRWYHRWYCSLLHVREAIDRIARRKTRASPSFYFINRAVFRVFSIVRDRNDRREWTCRLRVTRKHFFSKRRIEDLFDVEIRKLYSANVNWDAHLTYTQLISLTQTGKNELTNYVSLGFQVGPKEQASYPKGSSGRRKYGKGGQEKCRAARWWR